MVSDLPSALAMADRNTFCTSFATRFLVKRSRLIAAPASKPRIRSRTGRALRGDVRMYLASALASIVLSTCAFHLLPLRGFRSCRRSRSGSGTARLLGCPGPGVSLKDPRGRKFPEFVADHVLGDVHVNKFPPVMNGNGMPDKLRDHRGTARPGAKHLLLVPAVEVLDLFHQVA